jgi:hypothetical protein
MIERTCKSCSKKFMIPECGEICTIPDYCDSCIENLNNQFDKFKEAEEIAVKNTGIKTITSYSLPTMPVKEQENVSYEEEIDKLTIEQNKRIASELEEKITYKCVDLGGEEEDICLYNKIKKIFRNYLNQKELYVDEDTTLIDDLYKMFNEYQSKSNKNYHIMVEDLIDNLKYANDKLSKENSSMCQDISNLLLKNEDLKLKLKMIKKLMEG